MRKIINYFKNWFKKKKYEEIRKYLEENEEIEIKKIKKIKLKLFKVRYKYPFVG